MKETYKITKKDLFDLFTRLSGAYRIFTPYSDGDKLYFAQFNPDKEETIELGGIRQLQPLKSFYSPVREKISDKTNENSARPVIVAGVKACDLKSLKLQDFVFKGGDLEDPLYVKNREDTIIIANDCTYAKETCFCLAMDGVPYPRVDFDMALATIDDSFLVEIGTDRGSALIKDYKTFFSTASDNDIKLRDKNRDKVCAQVKEYIENRGTPDTNAVKGMVKKNYNLTELWKDSSSTCVECGACNLVCPTCHCFLLYDEKSGSGAKRMRIWDSCLYNSFARVAGGANPRKHLYERLRNRFDKKFAFFPEVLDYFACTGCGRCIEACPGDIDIREVLKALVKGKWNKPPHK